MMLRYIDELAAARAIEEAVLATLERGTYTRDVRPDGSVSTSAFADAVIASLGSRPKQWSARDVRALQVPGPARKPDAPRIKARRAVGVDVFIEADVAPEVLGPKIAALAEGLPVQLKMISNRGTKVYPATGAQPACVDHWRCRFVARPDVAAVTDEAIATLLQRVAQVHRWMHVEKLEEHDGAPAYTKAQGED
jgi:isocitrate dehydrogenase